MRGKREHAWRRFWRLVDRAAGDGCWLFRAADPGEYGSFSISADERVSAHRMAWELVNGEIPDGMNVCHSCDNRPCCRPDHLFLGTQLDNVRDMIAKGRQVVPPRRAECKRGHAFTPENTLRGKGGTQRCRECENARRRKPGGRGPYRRGEERAA